MCISLFVTNFNQSIIKICIYEDIDTTLDQAGLFGGTVVAYMGVQVIKSGILIGAAGGMATASGAGAIVGLPTIKVAVGTVAAGIAITGVGIVTAVSSGISLMNNSETENVSRSEEASGDEKAKDKELPKQEGRGQSKGGKHKQETLEEELAMEEAMTNPEKGKELKGKNTDPRWPEDEGWEKRTQNINGEEVHYQYNPKTGAIDDVKLK